MVTQNIDGLHQAAGLPQEAIAELHGNSDGIACLQCGTPYEPAEIERRIKSNTKLVVMNHGSNVIGTVQDVAVHRGFVEVSGDPTTVSILSDTAELAEELGQASA